MDRLPSVCALQRRLRVWPRCGLTCGALGWEAGVWPGRPTRGLRGSRRPPVPLSPGREVGVAAGARALATFTARPRLAPTLVSWCNYAVLSCFWDVCDFTQPARAPPTPRDGGAAGTPCRLLPRALKTALPRHALLVLRLRVGCAPWRWASRRADAAPVRCSEDFCPGAGSPLLCQQPRSQGLQRLALTSSCSKVS